MLDDVHSSDQVKSSGIAVQKRVKITRENTRDHLARDIDLLRADVYPCKIGIPPLLEKMKQHARPASCIQDGGVLAHRQEPSQVVVISFAPTPGQSNIKDACSPLDL